MPLNTKCFRPVRKKLHSLFWPFGIFPQICEYNLKKMLITDVNKTGNKRENFWERKFFYILGRFCWIAVYTYIKIILPYVGKLKLFQRFNAGVIVTDEKLSLLLLLPTMKYPPQSRHRRCIIIGNNDIGDILSALSVTKVVCPRIFLIIQNVPNGILRVLGETRSKKSRVRLPLKFAGHP